MSITIVARQRRVQQLLGRQRKLVVSLLEVREQLQGSVFTRFGTCGKTGCACGGGAAHGPYYVLSSRPRRSGGFAYLDRTRAAEAKRLVAGYRRFRGGLRRLRLLNRDLLAALKRYQEAVTRRGGHRIGL